MPGTHDILKRQSRHVCLESRGYAGDRPHSHGSQTECVIYIFPNLAEETSIRSGERQSHYRGRKLLEADFIREVYYPDWLANVVMVKKANGKWRMCVDFTDLNKACPKNNYPLPRIDTLVDSTARHQLLSFMDAFLGYN